MAKALMSSKSAIGAINRAGALLVFPMDNRKIPESIWSHFFPRKPMRWDWDESHDSSVGDLWHLRAELSTTRKVVYTKWFRGRATYFSFELFSALLRSLNPVDAYSGLGQDARKILNILEGESPLSTKEIKRLSGLEGRASETTYGRAMKELWSRCLVVAYGEVEDSSFPSLAVGATRVLFEDLWQKAWRLEAKDAHQQITDILPEQNLFYRHYLKLKTSGMPSVKRAKRPSVRSHVRFDEL
jgi:hypothetical protein